MVLRGTMMLMIALAGAAVQQDSDQEQQPTTRKSTSSPAAEFLTHMNLGKAYLDRGDADQAAAAFTDAVAVHPTESAARLNLANAYLLTGHYQEAIRHALEALSLKRDSAAAYYIIGCARNRLGRYVEAIKALQQSKSIDPGVAAVSFQLGRAYKQVQRGEEAMREWRITVGLQPHHPTAHYVLGQLLARAGRREEAIKELRIHERLLEQLQGFAPTSSALQQCKHTRAIVPQAIHQPDEHGVRVRFVDATSTVFVQPQDYSAPIAAIDVGGDNRIDLIARQGNEGFRLLVNRGGVFERRGPILPVEQADCYTRCLVGDLDNDHFEDCLLIGPCGSRLFRFIDGGRATDVTAEAGLTTVDGSDAILLDLDHTGTLDLLVISTERDTVRLWRNRGNATFEDVSDKAGIPERLTGSRHAVAVDWDSDQSTDVFVSRDDAPPLLLQNQLLGMVAPVQPPADWPIGHALAVDDLNNDLRPDLVIASDNKITFIFGGDAAAHSIDLPDGKISAIYLIDYDNDGYLDLCAVGTGIRILPSWTYTSWPI